MADCSESSDHTLLICSKCRGGEAASALRASISEALPDRFAIRAVNCMAGCDFPNTVGFQAKGKATYLFGHIDGPEDVAALVEFAFQYRGSSDGWTCATDRPAALYEKTLARIPALRTGVSS